MGTADSAALSRTGSRSRTSANRRWIPRRLGIAAAACLLVVLAVSVSLVFALRGEEPGAVAQTPTTVAQSATTVAQTTPLNSGQYCRLGTGC